MTDFAQVTEAVARAEQRFGQVDVLVNNADYAETASKRRKENDTVHGTQPGDPARAAAALVEVVSSGKMPELLVLGSDALSRLRSVVDGQRAEFEA